MNLKIKSYFKKYNSIENHYKIDIIEKWFKIYPELKSCLWVAEEKIDGSNISLYFKDGNYEIFSRNREIDKNEDFYGIRTLLKTPEYKNLIDLFLNLSLKFGVTYRVYGEIFGKSIQKRINYGNDIYYRIFDVEVNNVRLPPTEVEKLFNSLNISEYLIPVYTIDTIDNLLKIDINNLKSIWSNKLNIEAPVEGLVLKPYNKVYIVGGDIVYIKYKSEKFKEIIHTRKKVKEIGNPDVIKLNNKFRTYINENRILSVFSKNGKIREFSEISKYIKLVLNDAKEDFIKDLNQEETGVLNNLKKAEYKVVFNVGSQIANKVKGFLINK